MWGAEGERYWENTCVAGKGGYSSGEKTLSFSTKLYVAIGGKANNNTGVAYYANSGGYNGGGNGQLGGGGATHIAITNDRVTTQHPCIHEQSSHCRTTVRIALNLEFPFFMAVSAME